MLDANPVTIPVTLTCGPVAFIPIAIRKGEVSRRWAKVDAADAATVQQFMWRMDTHGYAQAWSGRWPDRQLITMHRLICATRLETDHRNRNPLDNRRENLRACTHRQNMRNLGAMGKYKGVCWHRHNRKWIARIRTSKGRVHLGVFKSAEAAARAYDRAARKYHGEFAFQNFPSAA